MDEDGRRINAKKADYVLFYPNAYSGQPIAVVEAKKASKDVLAGLEQAKRYMNLLGVTFAYATNGREIVEYDSITKKARKKLKAFRLQMSEAVKINTSSSCRMLQNSLTN